MARNLCTSICVECNQYLFTLADLRNQPIEFRQYANEPPVIGCAVNCPNCSRKYFAWWRESKWDIAESKFGKYVIDLSYYESFDDEAYEDYDDSVDYTNPAWLCTDNASEWQQVWGEQDDNITYIRRATQNHEMVISKDNNVTTDTE